MFPVVDLGRASARAPYGPKFSQFHAVFRKIWQNHMLAPPRRLAPSPTGNPGPAPGSDYIYTIYNLHHDVI